VASAKYPLSRPLQFYANSGKISEGATAFLRRVLSTPGQEVVRFVAFFPLTRQGPSGDATGIAPVKLSSANMKEHGFVMRVRYDQVPPKGGEIDWTEDYVMVDVAFDPSGGTAKDLRAVRVRVGDMADIPLELSRDEGGVVRGARFRVRPTLAPDTTLMLEVGPPAPGSVRTFQVHLGDFASGSGP